MKAQVIKPSHEDQKQKHRLSVFLAGSIEMGKAEDWQVRIETELKDYPITIFNPRRDDWDSSWEQKSTNPQFNYQVNWEMNSLEEASIIFMYFSPETKSPISLLELGLHAEDQNMIVCCPDGFWRKGNVEIVCQRHRIPLHNSLEDAIAALKSLVYSYIPTYNR
jgi:hypothetical protein